MSTILRTLTILIVASLFTACTPAAPAAPATPATASANISRVWARAATIDISSAYMTIENPNSQPLTLISVSSESVPIIEIHESRVVDDVMRMGILPDGLTIAPAESIDFEESGYHLMLINLPAALEVDDTISLTLTFALADGTQFTMTVDAPVSFEAPA